MSMKRKSTVALGATETPNKRRKSTQGGSQETPESTTTAGLNVVNHVKNARDKQENLIATNFLHLPTRRDHPDYYEVIALPIAIETIEEKLNRREYHNLSEVESDFKRMIQNAKDYNEKGSDIHNDAEKIRKNISNHMRKVNPAYEDGSGYQATPTPIPNSAAAGIKIERTPSKHVTPSTTVDDKKKTTLKLNGPRSAKVEPSRASSTPAAQDAEDDRGGFAKLSFQKAQEQLVKDIIDYVNDDGIQVSENFKDLPPRKLQDYYQVIKNPLCLNKIKKRVLGVVGREAPTGVSLYKNWQQLADDMNLIVSNARRYNQPGSGIVDEVNQLEDIFKKTFAKAKSVPEPVPEPPVRINLKVGGRSQESAEQPPLKIRIGTKSHAADTNGVMVDSAALKRQQELVAAGANGRTSAMPSNSPAADAGPASAGPANGVGSSRPVTANGASEPHHSASPAPQITLARNGSVEGASMPPPPPGLTPRLHSGSPLPQVSHTPVPPPPANPLENRFRAPGKTAADALLQQVTISAHPMLKLPNSFRLPIYAHNKLSQVSTTMHVTSNCTWIRVEPVYAPAVFQRQHNLFSTLNHQKIAAVKVDQPDMRRPIYEARLLAGLNTIECEVITGPVRGTPKIGNHTDVEYEKVTVYVNVMSA